ncbi:MAG: hypothetical protein IJ153_11020 [Clostridia bacterium]|nr:hypothetical protein [Clostridia bacterium]MBQ9212218.1 hypothetical protein [Clostridia bacterium]
MTHEQVDAMLAEYRESVGRCGYLEKRIPELAAEIEQEKARLIQEAAQESPSMEPGMPHGSGVGNPVEKIVLRYADGFLPDEIRGMDKELRELRDEYARRQRVIQYVDAWLQGLNEREKWIIIHKVVDVEYSWREVICMYRLQYGEEYSRDALKRIKERALEKIYKFAA